MIPNLSLVGVIIIVLLLAGLLDRLLFKPVLRVIETRRDAVDRARRLAEQAQARAAAAAAEAEARMAAARAEIYRQLDEVRRRGLERRTELVGAARREAEELVARVRDELATDLRISRAALEREADRLGDLIAERVLGRPVSPGQR